MDVGLARTQLLCAAADITASLSHPLTRWSILSSGAGWCSFESEPGCSHQPAIAAKSPAVNQRHCPAFKSAGKSSEPIRERCKPPTPPSPSTRLPTAAIMRLTWWYLPSVSVRLNWLGPVCRQVESELETPRHSVPNLVVKTNSN